MKIVKNTKDKMVIVDRPFLTGVGLLAFSFFWLWLAIKNLFDGDTSSTLPFVIFIALLSASTLFIRSKTIELDRSSDKLLVKTKSIRGETTESYSLHSIARAELEEQRSIRHNGTQSGWQYRIFFVIQQKGADEDSEPQFIYPTQMWYSGGRTITKKFQSLVDAINAWLDNRP